MISYVAVQQIAVHVIAAAMAGDLAHYAAKVNDRLPMAQYFMKTAERLLHMEMTPQRATHFWDRMHDSDACSIFFKIARPDLLERLQGDELVAYKTLCAAYEHVARLAVPLYFQSTQTPVEPGRTEPHAAF